MKKARTDIDYGKIRPDVLSHFWSHVDRSGDCWEWTGLTNGKYGMFYLYREDGKSRYMLSHRFIEFAMNGEIDEDTYILHKCDNPLCVRLSHLFRGSHQDNVRDMRQKGRQSDPPLISGTRHHSNKLSEDQVREIRKRRSMGESGYKLASEFGVSNAMIYDIATGKKWKHLV